VKVMYALASNIAVFHARGAISEAEAEVMLTQLVSIDPELLNFVVNKIEREKHFDQGGIVPPYIWSIFQHHESVDFTPRKSASKETNDTKLELETIPTVNPIE
jgi:hypothetical protein